MKTYLGITAQSHDASAAVINEEGDILFAGHSERYSRIKNDPWLDKGLIDDCLLSNDNKPFDAVFYYEKPLIKKLRQFRAGQYDWAFTTEDMPKKYIKKFTKVNKFKTFGHHYTHATAGYFTSRFNDATIIVIDSIGEFETYTVWKAEYGILKQVYSQKYPHSIGLWYSAMTQRLGLKPQEDEYILMGMAAYGDPKRYKARILTDMFNLKGMPDVHFKINLHKGCPRWAPDIKTEQDYFDLAAATQEIYEEIFDGIVCHWRGKLPSRNLVLAGGCALNCVANGKASQWYDKIWIMPNPGDAGSAIGAVAAHLRKQLNWTSPLLGHDIQGNYPHQSALRALRKNEIFGVASGKAEFGPRALGNRSLLADPRGSEIKDRVNKYKKRQEFRPFAPAILEEHVNEYFSMPYPTSPYMQFIAKCKKPEEFPAIIHADGTSRVQTVNQTEYPDFYKLIKAFYDKTGCPMVLNTSLNIKGQPIVNTIQDAKLFKQEYDLEVYIGGIDP
tara:strand:- start:4261 stop:5763 length:1503 start_codon:yes stop_codon:yes gene_type:complete